MTNEEMIDAWKNWLRVRTINIDASLNKSGLLVSCFCRRFHPNMHYHSEINRQGWFGVLETDDKEFVLTVARKLKLDLEYGNVPRKIKFSNDD